MATPATGSGFSSPDSLNIQDPSGSTDGSELKKTTKQTVHSTLDGFGS